MTKNIQSLEIKKVKSKNHATLTLEVWGHSLKEGSLLIYDDEFEEYFLESTGSTVLDMTKEDADWMF